MTFSIGTIIINLFDEPPSYYLLIVYNEKTTLGLKIKQPNLQEIKTSIIDCLSNKDPKSSLIPLSKYKSSLQISHVSGNVQLKAFNLFKSFITELKKCTKHKI